jgi:predicted metal-binding membrane protein
VIRRDRFLFGLALVIVSGLAWAYLVRTASAMRAAGGEAAMHAAMGMTMPGGASSALDELGSLWLMWTIMMAAMMLASAAPVALLVLGSYRRRDERSARACGVAFVAGYLLVWSLFSGLAAVAQLLLRRATLLSPDMATTSRLVAAAVLISAGVYQWLPIKAACLAHCQSPIEFLFRHWRAGVRGAFSMGARHGAYCVGCCWMLMALLFVGGVMNLLWVAAIALFVLVEKQLRLRGWPSRFGGVLLVAWGVVVTVAPR